MRYLVLSMILPFFAFGQGQHDLNLTNTATLTTFQNTHTLTHYPTPDGEAAWQIDFQTESLSHLTLQPAVQYWLVSGIAQTELEIDSYSLTGPFLMLFDMATGDLSGLVNLYPAWEPEEFEVRYQPGVIVCHGRFERTQSTTQVLLDELLAKHADRDTEESIVDNGGSSTDPGGTNGQTGPGGTGGIGGTPLSAPNQPIKQPVDRDTEESIVDNGGSSTDPGGTNGQTGPGGTGGIGGTPLSAPDQPIKQPVDRDTEAFIVDNGGSSTDPGGTNGQTGPGGTGGIGGN